MAHSSAKIVFTNATVLDGAKGMQPRPHATVVVEGGKIARVVYGGDVESDASARIVDLGGAYLMPGLINMHVHFCGSGKPVSAGDAGSLMKKIDNPVGRAILRRIIKKHAQTQLASGVTTVRGAGDPLLSDIAVRDAIESGRYAGPRIVAPGTGVTVPNGHGAGLFAQVAASPQEAAEQVRDLAKNGVDVIKLFITGGVFDATEPGEPGVLRMPLEIAKEACAAAHEAGLPVMAHVESTEGVRVALEAGVDTVEHGAPMTPEVVELYRSGASQLKGRKPSVTCTISPALPFALLDPAKTNSTEVQKVNGDIVCAGIIESARTAVERGIPVGLGTDSSCPYVTHYDMWREVAYFAKYVGVSNAFALHTATQVNADLLGLGDVTGRIEEGYDADILVTDGNPLEDLAALRTPRMVMARGVFADGLRIKHLRNLDEDLDWIMARPAESAQGVR